MKKEILTGEKFGKLLVGEEAPKTKGGHTSWHCTCECGNVCIRTSTSLKRSKFSSCGCWSRYGRDHPQWEGVGEISAAWFYNVISRAANGRKSRSGIKKKLDIDIHYIWDLFLQQNRKCAYSGLELTFPEKSTTESYTKSTASLDRIDSSKGYIKGNVQWVHKMVNIMKNTYSHDEFLNMCKLITKHNE